MASVVAIPQISAVPQQFMSSMLANIIRGVKRIGFIPDTEQVFPGDFNGLYNFTPERFTCDGDQYIALVSPSQIINQRQFIKLGSGMENMEVLRRESIFKSPAKMYPCLALTEAGFKQTKQAVDLATASLST